MYDSAGFNQERLKRHAQQLKAEFARADDMFREYFGKGHAYESAIADNPGERVDAFKIFGADSCHRVGLNSESMRFLAAEGQETADPAVVVSPAGQET